MTDTTPSTTVRVEAYLNTALPTETMFGYSGDHEVVRTFATDDSAAWDDADICERVFELLNIGHEGAETDARAVEYRARGNRPVDRTTGRHAVVSVQTAVF